MVVRAARVHIAQWSGHASPSGSGGHLETSGRQRQCKVPDDRDVFLPGPCFYAKNDVEDQGGQGNDFVVGRDALLSNADEFYNTNMKRVLDDSGAKHFSTKN